MGEVTGPNGGVERQPRDGFFCLRGELLLCVVGEIRGAFGRVEGGRLRSVSGGVMRGGSKMDAIGVSHVRLRVRGGTS